MPNDSHDISPVFRIDVAQSASEPQLSQPNSSQEEVVALLHQLVIGQDRQNELLEEMLHQQQAQQRQRASDLRNWRQSNPALAKECRSAVEALSAVQNQFLFRMAEDIQESADELSDGGFMLNEFVDRYGPRIAHLNGVMQILSQLGGSGSSNRSHD